jgi:hypothetical protein
VRWYREYLEGFNAAPEAAATRLLLADLLFEGKRYIEAAEEYEQAAYSYANATEAGRAGYAAPVLRHGRAAAARGPATGAAAEGGRFRRCASRARSRSILRRPG